MNHSFPLPPAADSPDTQDGGPGRDWQPLCTQASWGGEAGELPTEGTVTTWVPMKHGEGSRLDPGVQVSPAYTGRRAGPGTSCANPAPLGVCQSPRATKLTYHKGSGLKE